MKMETICRIRFLPLFLICFIWLSSNNNNNNNYAAAATTDAQHSDSNVIDDEGLNHLKVAKIEDRYEGHLEEALEKALEKIAKLETALNNGDQKTSNNGEHDHNLFFDAAAIGTSLSSSSSSSSTSASSSTVCMCDEEESNSSSSLSSSTTKKKKKKYSGPRGDSRTSTADTSSRRLRYRNLQNPPLPKPGPPKSNNIFNTKNVKKNVGPPPKPGPKPGPKKKKTKTKKKKNQPKKKTPPSKKTSPKITYNCKPNATTNKIYNETELIDMELDCAQTSSCFQPGNYTAWPFNRGLASLTIGSYKDITNPDPDPLFPPPTSYTLVANNACSSKNCGESKGDNGSSGYALTAAVFNQTNETTIANSGGLFYDPISSVSTFSGSPFVNNVAYGVTAVSWIVPYKNGTLDTDAIARNKTLYFLVGYSNGDVYSGYTKLIDANNSATWSTTYPVGGADSIISLTGDSGKGFTNGGVSEILYVPQNNAVVMYDYTGNFYTFNVTWQFETEPILSEPPLEYSEFTSLESGFAGTGLGYANGYKYLPRSLVALRVNSDVTYLYSCGLYYTDPTTNEIFNGTMTIFSLNSSNELSFVSKIENTNQCYQIIPTLFGLYFAAQGGAVFFIPFESYNPNSADPIPSNGVLGDDPDVFLIYPNEGGDSIKDDIGLNDTVSNIVFTSNSNNVVIYRNPLTNETNEFFTGGALFISTTKISTIGGGSCNLDPKGDEQTATIGPACPGSILLSDVCTGAVSTFIDNFVDGSIYSAVADVNMNLLTQNGQGGLSTFSVGYVPGSVSAGNFIENQSSTCSNGVLGVIKAALQVVVGILKVTGVLEDIKADVIGWAGDLAACCGIAGEILDVGLLAAA